MAAGCGRKYCMLARWSWARGRLGSSPTLVSIDPTMATHASGVTQRSATLYTSPTRRVSAQAASCSPKRQWRDGPEWDSAL